MAPPPTAGISVRDLTKRYGAVTAVRGVSFDVGPGEIFGLLGLNGAGKTTTLECILGLRRPDAGAISLDGIDVLAEPIAVRRRVGAQLQTAALQDKITPRQALNLWASFYRDTIATGDLLARFGLTAKADACFETLSGGQRQRLFLALALVNQPHLVVLDEPTAGLDPRARRELQGIIRQLKTEGRAVLLSTHYLEEAEQLCDRVGILHEGRIIARDAPAALIAGSKAAPRLLFRPARPLDPAALPGLGAVRPHRDRWELSTPDVTGAIGRLTRHLAATGNELLDLEIRRPSLEDVFLELTGRTWDEPAQTSTP
jgi:ABC-2 type transport system ATP-binding protein